MTPYSPDVAYAAMVKAVETGNDFAAYSTALILRDWFKRSPGEAQFFKRSRMMNVFSTYAATKRRLEASPRGG